MLREQWNGKPGAVTLALSVGGGDCAVRSGAVADRRAAGRRGSNTSGCFVGRRPVDHTGYRASGAVALRQYGGYSLTVARGPGRLYRSSSERRAR